MEILDQKYEIYFIFQYFLKKGIIILLPYIGMKILKKKKLNGNILNCTITIREKVIHIKNFNIEKNIHFMNSGYIIYFKREKDNIYYYYKKIFKVHFLKKYNNCFNLKKCFRKSKFIEITEKEKNSDILFLNPLQIKNTMKKKKWINNIPSIDNILIKVN